MDRFLEEILDVVMDFPININICGFHCATTDLLSYVLWAMNGYQTLDCANVIYNLLLGAC